MEDSLISEVVHGVGERMTRATVEEAEVDTEVVVGAGGEVVREAEAATLQDLQMIEVRRTREGAKRRAREVEQITTGGIKGRGRWPEADFLADDPSRISEAAAVYGEAY